MNLEAGLKIDYGTLTNQTFGTDIQMVNGRREFSWALGNMSGNYSALTYHKSDKTLKS